MCRSPPPSSKIEPQHPSHPDIRPERRMTCRFLLAEEFLAEPSLFRNALGSAAACF